MQVLDTLTAADRVSVMVFGSIASCVNPLYPRYDGATICPFMQADKTTIAQLAQRVGSLTTAGTTNFVGAFRMAFESFGTSIGPDFRDPGSPCTSVVLFLSDGTPDRWTQDDVRELTDVWRLKGTSTGARPHVLTYALGSGAPVDTLQDIACR